MKSPSLKSALNIAAGHFSNHPLLARPTDQWQTAFNMQISRVFDATKRELRTDSHGT
jgi:hypothetical protein